VVRHHPFHPLSALSQARVSLHFRCIVFEESEVITADQEIAVLEISAGHAFQNCFGLRHPSQQNIDGQKIEIPKLIFGRDRDRDFTLLNRLFVLTGASRHPSRHQRMSVAVARIHLRPQFERFERHIEVFP
jgi:hypothetical protein